MAQKAGELTTQNYLYRLDLLKKSHAIELEAEYAAREEEMSKLRRVSVIVTESPILSYFPFFLS